MGHRYAIRKIQNPDSKMYLSVYEIFKNSAWNGEIDELSHDLSRNKSK